MSDDTTAKSNVNLDIEYDELKKFLDELADKKKTVSSANGTLRARLNTILETTGLHPKALADIRKIEAMSNELRADYRRSFDVLYDLMVANKWADDEVDLFTPGEEKKKTKVEAPKGGKAKK